MPNVLFVCLGNICRSPTGEAILRRLQKEQGWVGVIDSAGTGDWHTGEQPDPRAQAVLKKNGLGDYRHAARQLRSADFQEFDFILCMDENNVRDVNRVRPKSVAGKAKVVMLGDYDPEKQGVIIDTYYGGPEGFDKCFAQLERVLKAFCEQECGSG